MSSETGPAQGIELVRQGIDDLISVALKLAQIGVRRICYAGIEANRPGLNVQNEIPLVYFGWYDYFRISLWGFDGLLNEEMVDSYSLNLEIVVRHRQTEEIKLQPLSEIIFDFMEVTEHGIMVNAQWNGVVGSVIVSINNATDTTDDHRNIILEYLGNYVNSYFV